MSGLWMPLFRGRFGRAMSKSKKAKGLTIIYIGDGKGKTSAAVGLACRAKGTNFKVLFLQFVKGDMPSGERKALAELGVDVKLMGLGFVGIINDKRKRDEHVEAAKKALAISMIHVTLNPDHYDLVILDEALSAAEIGLLTEAELEALIKHKQKDLHLCLTGHKRYKKLIALADLVTEMKMIKHPYYEGIIAQRGIDY